MSPFTLKDIFDKYNLLENEVRVFLMTKSFMDNHPDDNDSNFRNVYFGNSRFTTAKWLSIVPKKLYTCKYILFCFSTGSSEWVIEGLYEVLGEPTENINPDRSIGESRWVYPMKRADNHDLSSKLSLQIKFLYQKRQNYVLLGETVSSSPAYILPNKIDFNPIFDKQINEPKLKKDNLVIDFRKIAERYIFFVNNKDDQALRESRKWMSADSMDKIITIGKSEKWSVTNSRKEHIVPCKLIHERLIELARENQIEEMIDVISKYLKIVLVSQDESAYIDFGLQLKTKMPSGWKWGDDRMARLKVGKVRMI